MTVDIERLRALYQRIDDAEYSVIVDDLPIAKREFAAALHNALPAILAEFERARRIEAAAQRVAQWTGFPRAKLHDGTPCSYGVAYGSNGERDYMRELLRTALAKERSDG